MLRRKAFVVAAIMLCVGNFASAQLPEPMPVPVHVPPTGHQYPAGVVDMTPESLPKPHTSSPTCHFVPINDPVAPFVMSVEYLLIRPHRHDLDYAIVDPNNNLAPEGRVASLDWQTRSGIRAGFIWRPRGGVNDVAFTYTNAYSRDTAEIAAPNGGVLFPSLTRPGIVDQALTARAFSSISFNVFDIDAGRTFHVDETEYRIFTGVRLADINQVLAATYDGLDAHQALSRQRSCMEGGGISFGGEARWKFTQRFGAFARGRGSLVVGDYCVSAFESDFAGNVINADVSDRFTKVVPVLDLAAGISYQRRNMRASIGYELSHWFNQAESISFLDDFAFGKHGRRQSDLSLEAVTFQLAFDF